MLTGNLNLIWHFFCCSIVLLSYIFCIYSLFICQMPSLQSLMWFVGASQSSILALIHHSLMILFCLCIIIKIFILLVISFRISMIELMLYVGLYYPWTTFHHKMQVETLCYWYLIYQLKIYLYTSSYADPIIMLNKIFAFHY